MFLLDSSENISPRSFVHTLFMIRRIVKIIDIVDKFLLEAFPINFRDFSLDTSEKNDIKNFSSYSSKSYTSWVLNGS